MDVIDKTDIVANMETTEDALRLHVDKMNAQPFTPSKDFPYKLEEIHDIFIERCGKKGVEFLDLSKIPDNWLIKKARTTISLRHSEKYIEKMASFFSLLKQVADLQTSTNSSQSQLVLNYIYDENVGQEITAPAIKKMRINFKNEVLGVFLTNLILSGIEVLYIPKIKRVTKLNLFVAQFFHKLDKNLKRRIKNYVLDSVVGCGHYSVYNPSVSLTVKEATKGAKSPYFSATITITFGL